MDSPEPPASSRGAGQDRETQWYQLAVMAYALTKLSTMNRTRITRLSLISLVVTQQICPAVRRIKQLVGKGLIGVKS